MKAQEVIHIAIAESSVIVRTGLANVLKRLPDLNIQTIEVTSTDGLRHCINVHKPDILIVNPSFDGWFDVASFKNGEEDTGMKIIALIYTMVNANRLNGYDERIDLFDDEETLSRKISSLISFEEEEDDRNTLSQREKEIVECVVKGMTNKEIAENLYISIHTVMTHRRNITRKLQIHSAAGLTIYAIVNKLVQLNEVKMKL